MVLRKRIKDIVFILLVLILAFTVLFFSDGMSKSAAEENKYASGLEVAITTSSYLFNAFALFYPLIILLGAAAYFLYSSHKSRYGMVLASGLVLSSTPSFVAAWLWVIGIRSMGVQWEQFGFFDREQIAGVLFMPIFLSTAYLIAWILMKPVVQRFFPKILSHPNFPKKKTAYRRYWQAYGIIFSVLTLAMLPTSLYALKNSRAFLEITELGAEWYLCAGVHGISGILAGLELFMGIRLILEQTRGKFSLGTLLLGSSFIGFLSLWLCLISSLGYTFDWDIGSYRIYMNSALCVIVQQIVSVTAIGIGILLCKKEK